MRTNEQTVIACRVNPACGSPAALRFIAIVDEAKLHEGLARVGHINRAVSAAPCPELGVDGSDGHKAKVTRLTLMNGPAVRCKRFVDLVARIEVRKYPNDLSILTSRPLPLAIGRRQV